MCIVPRPAATSGITVRPPEQAWSAGPTPTGDHQPTSERVDDEHGALVTARER
jgi:hypothetical protein